MTLPDFWNKYPADQMPFLVEQRQIWSNTKPLAGVRILHNTPLTIETLIKVDCLIAAGALVTVTRTKFIRPEESNELHQILQNLNVHYVAEHSDLAPFKHDFDLALDCGAELLHLIEPHKGFVELTGSGTLEFQTHANTLKVPAMSIDDSKTKQLETFFGTANGFIRAIQSLSDMVLDNQNVVLFGYGKVGAGIIYGLLPYTRNITVVDIDANAIMKARSKGLIAIHPSEQINLERAISAADLVVTAAGDAHCVTNLIPAAALQGKLLANMSAEDDFGDLIATKNVLGAKQPVNFLLESPTLMRYLDPSFYAHNLAAMLLIQQPYSAGYHAFDSIEDAKIMTRWQHYFTEDLSVMV